MVTGGASGIGAAVVTAFLRAGARVVSADLAIPKEVRKGVIEQVCDVSDQAQVEALFASCRLEHHRVDVVFHAAGIGGGQAPIASYEVPMWDRVMEVNLRGTFLVLRSAISSMLENGGGSIVLTASVGGAIAAPLAGAYGVSKAGVQMLVKQAAADYASQGIRVNAIAPGIIDTPLVAGLDTEMRDVIASHVPQARLGLAEEVASVVLFLASEAASYVNGAILPVDGGRLAV